MTDVTVHTCPKCELRFAQLFELYIHLDQDHEHPDEGLFEAHRLPHPDRSLVVGVDPAHPHPGLVAHAGRLAHALGLGVELVAVAPAGLLDEAHAHVRANAAVARVDDTSHVTTWVEEGADVVAGLRRRLDVAPADLVVVAPRSRHDLGHVFGSTATGLCATSPVPVVLVGRHVDPEPIAVDRVVACLDGSDAAKDALAVADRLRTRMGVDLHLVEAMADAVMPADVLESNELRRYAGTLSTPPSDYDVLHGADVPAAIERYVQDRPSTMVVLGSHGRTGWSRLLHGSVGGRLVDHHRGLAVIVPPTVLLGRTLVSGSGPSAAAAPTSGPARRRS